MIQRAVGDDLLGGTRNSHIANLVERHSRFTALVKVVRKDMAAVVPHCADKFVSSQRPCGGRFRGTEGWRW